MGSPMRPSPIQPMECFPAMTAFSVSF